MSGATRCARTPTGPLILTNRLEGEHPRTRFHQPGRGNQSGPDRCDQQQSGPRSRSRVPTQLERDRGTDSTPGDMASQRQASAFAASSVALTATDPIPPSRCVDKPSGDRDLFRGRRNGHLPGDGGECLSCGLILVVSGMVVLHGAKRYITTRIEGAPVLLDHLVSAPLRHAQMPTHRPKTLPSRRSGR